MAAPKIFATGVTGYVGGDTMTALISAHPDWHYTFLVRDSTRAAPVAARWPSARLVYGDLSKRELLFEEAKNADIVLHFASSDHVEGAQAIVDGLRAKTTPGYLIHTSGTGMLPHDDIQASRYGHLSPKIYDDVKDIEEITNFPSEMFHVPVDKVMLAASKGYPHIKNAVVCPPVIVGTGRGPVNTRSLGLPILIQLFRQRKKPFIVGEGKSQWSLVHIKDLAKLYVMLAEAAAAGGGNASWGAQSYYYVGEEEIQWGEATKLIVQIMQKKHPQSLESFEVDSISGEEAQSFNFFAAGAFGANARTKATRALAMGWRAEHKDQAQPIEEAVDEEFKCSQSRLDDMAKGNFPAPATPAA